MSAYLMLMIYWDYANVQHIFRREIAASAQKREILIYSKYRQVLSGSYRIEMPESVISITCKAGYCRLDESRARADNLLRGSSHYSQ